jgi:hypothetical protein
MIEGTNLNVTVDVNPADDDGNYALITLKNLSPGDFTVSVQPRTVLELASVNVDLNKFVEAPDTDKNPLAGNFPDDEGLDPASLFDDMGTMGKNINFNRLDLYLYMNGDRELLEDTTFSLTAVTGTGEGDRKVMTDGYQEFDNLESEKTPPDFDSITDDIYDKKLENEQFKTDEMLDVINNKSSSLKIAYDIKLADHVEIDGDGLMEEARPIQFRPELILVMPLQLRLLAEGDADYGSLKLTESEAVTDPKSEDDMFGRTGPDDKINEYLEQLKQVRLRVDYDNSVGMDKTSFYIFSQDYDGETVNWEKPVPLSEGVGKTLSLDLSPDDFKIYPFRPGVEIRVPNETGKNYGLIGIKRGGEGRGGIRAKITVEMESHIDLVVDL